VRRIYVVYERGPCSLTPPIPTLAMKFGKGKGKAKDERRDGYLPIRDEDESGSSPHETHELVAQDATASGAQPGPSGQSRTRRLQEAEKLRAQARQKGEERNELREQAQKARELGESSLAETLMKLAKKCWNAMKRFNGEAANIFYKGGSWRAGAEYICLDDLLGFPVLNWVRQFLLVVWSPWSEPAKYLVLD
jgi:hypothetical protein